MGGMRAGRFSYKQERELIGMAAKGASVSQIAAKLRTTATTIERMAERLQVSVREDKKNYWKELSLPRTKL